MSHPTSLRITEEAKQALTWLRQQPGSFNLNAAVSAWIIQEAKRRKGKEKLSSS